MSAEPSLATLPSLVYRVERTTPPLAFKRLEVAGVLTPLSGAARNRAWQATEALELLDAFAARARRAR